MEAEYKPVERENKTWCYFWRQMFICTTANEVYFMIGLNLGAPTVVMPQLKQEANSTSIVSDSMASLINSIVPYTAVFWILVLLLATHNFGRKKPMIAVAVNSLCGFLVFYYSENISHLFINQLIQGLTQASHTTTLFMIVLEYTSPEYRGVFLGLFSATYFWGIWVANAIGTFFNYRYIGLCGIVCAATNCFSLFFIPESPYWLACQKRFEECSKVNRWLKGVDVEAEKELVLLIKSQSNTQDILAKPKRTIKNSICQYFKVLKDPEIYKPIFLNFLLLTSYYLCGKLVCAVYAVEIMKKITKTESEAYTGVLILDGFSVTGMYVGSVLSRYFKRLTLLIGSSVICAVFLFVFAVYLYLVSFSVISENIYISSSLLIGFTLAACIGPIVVSASIFAELYPSKYRSFTMFIMCVMSKITFGVVIHVAPYIFKGLRVHGAFLFFAITFSISLILVKKYVPETKDKSMQEIAKMFRKKENYRNVQLNLLESDKL